MSIHRKQPSLASLRNRVSLWRQIETDNTSGGTEFTLAALGQSWARLEVKSGQDGYTGAGTSNATQFEFTLRYDATLKVGDLIEWQGAHYQIDHLENLGQRNAYLVCGAKHIEWEGAHHG